MAHPQTATKSATFTVADIKDVVRQFKTDLKMMAHSSGAMPDAEVDQHTYDVEVLAIEGFVSYVDVTLLDQYSNEVRAVRYDVDEATGSVTVSRPGGVMWPKTPGGSIRVVIGKAKDLTDAVRGKLKQSWGASTDDTSHSSLKASGGRSYASNGYGLHRKDFE